MKITFYEGKLQNQHTPSSCQPLHYKVKDSILGNESLDDMKWFSINYQYIQP